jgi:hypothetical protein
MILGNFSALNCSRALTSGARLAAGDLAISDGLIGDGAGPARGQDARAAAGSAAGRTGGLLAARKGRVE